MKKANLACAPLSVARISGKFGSINLTRLQAKFDGNLKFKSKFCGADGFLKFNPNLSNLLKFDEAPSKFDKSVNMQHVKPSQNKASDFYTDSLVATSNFKLQNQKERTNK